ncbi:MAG: CHAT domain-containing protein [Candidatus Eisenbacteria sp.]|nr:CHAT domain-containing protein [Candidatus Eisenbacteria bacterium]
MPRSDLALCPLNLRAALLVALIAFLGLSATLLPGCGEQYPAPAREEVHFPQAEAARRAGDYDAAIAAYRRSIAVEPDDPRPYFGIVESHARRGDLTAVEALLDSLALADPHNASVHYGLACLAVKRQDLETALAEARQTIALDAGLGHGHLLLGSVRYYAGESEQALEAWERARAIFRRQGDRKYEAWSLNRTALVRRELGDLRQALGEFQEALRLHRELGDRQAQQLVLGNIGLAQADLGDLAGALEAFQEALDLAWEIGDREGACWGLTNLSYVANLTGQHHQAIAYADSAIGLARQTGNRIDEVTGLVSRATASLDLGDPVGALQDAGEALALADSIVDPRHGAAALTVRGRAALNLGRLEQARESYARANDRFHEMGIETGSWEARIGLCGVAIQEGDAGGAIELAEATMADCAAAEYAEGEEYLALTLCELKREQADAEVLLDPAQRNALLDEALQLASRAVELSRRDGRRKREAIALARRARVHLLAANHDIGNADTEAQIQAARRDVGDACRLATDIRSPEVTWECELVAGDVATADMELNRACSHYRAAMDALEEIRRDLRLEEFKAAYLAGRIDLYYKTAALLARRGDPQGAFAVCERARARAFRDLLAASPRPLAPQVDAALAQERATIETQLRTLQASRSAMAARGIADRDRIAEMDGEIHRMKQRWEEVRTEILLADPQYGMLISAPTHAPLEIVERLNPDEALLEYLLGPDSSLCFLARAEGITVVPLPVGRAALAGQIRALRRPMQAPRSLATLEFDLELAHRIRAAIFDPLIPHLTGVTRVLVVPDGALHYLPFGALPLPEDSSLQTLVEDSPSSDVPWRRAASRTVTGSPRAVQDPTAANRGDADQPASGALPLHAEFRDIRFLEDLFVLEVLPSASLIARAGEAEHETGSGRALADDGIHPFSSGLLAMGHAPTDPSIGWGATARPLAHVEQEIQAIARSVPDAVVAVDSAASELRFKTTAPRFARLHLATHGNIDEAVPLYSGLHLAPDPAGREDGALHAFEILELPLRCELVTLSACQTGLGRLYAGEGPLGLARAFFYAGADQVLVSLWSVDDASTAMLMGQFYENMTQGDGAAVALRKARRSLRGEFRTGSGGERALSYAHPYFWAPFVLIRAAGSD